MDYYAILGIARDAEDIVVGAAYRAMVKKYHPDVFRGPKARANAKIREINEAYETLSDPKKRSEYDKATEDENEGIGDYEKYEDENDTPSVLAKDWSIFIEYYPEAEKNRADLSKLSQSAAFQYQVIVLTLKAGEDHEEWAAAVKSNFMGRYFGTNKKLHKFVEQLLLKGHRSIALEINKAIKVLGVDHSPQVITNVKQKYAAELYGEVVGGTYEWAEPFEQYIFSYALPAEYEYFIDIGKVIEKKQLNVNVTCMELGRGESENESTEYAVVYFEIDTIRNLIRVEPEDDRYFEELSFDSFNEAKTLISSCMDKYA